MLGGALPVGCGQCLPCRVNRRRLWTARQLLESYTHNENCFVTLTYDQLPTGGSLVPGHLTNFVKRLRKNLGSANLVRYFAVGEYGDHTFRPHYHLSLFGVSQADAPFVIKSWDQFVPDKKEDWSPGFSMTAEFNKFTAQYVCGYTVKKMTHRNDTRLEGRYPEFARMSNRPGIGAKAMPVIADAILTDVGLDEYNLTGDVPMALNKGKNGKLPLGRYLRHKLREEIGVSEKEQEEIKARWAKEKNTEVLTLLSRSILDGEALSTSQLIARQNQGRIAQIEKRDSIHNSRKML